MDFNVPVEYSQNQANNKRLAIRMPGLAASLVFILLWYTISTLRLVDLPTPWDSSVALVRLIVRGDPLFELTIQQFVWASLKIVLRAWLLSLLLAIPLGIWMGYFRPVEKTISPIIEILRPMPPLAWIPLAYVLFSGFSNPTDWVQIFVVFVGSFFPVLVTTAGAIRSVDPLYLDVAQSIGARPLQILTRVIIPAIVPSIITGMRIGLGVGWMCIVAAEFVGGKKGIGFYIWTSYNIGGRAPEIVAGMTAIGLTGYAMNKSLLYLQKRLAPWH